MTFIEAFHKLCDDAGVAPTHVCTDIGLSDAIYSRWKKNDTKAPRASTVRKLAEYFGVSEDVVLGKIQEEPQTKTDKELIDMMLQAFTLLSTRSKVEVIAVCNEKLALEKQYAHA